MHRPVSIAHRVTLNHDPDSLSVAAVAAAAVDRRG